MFCSYFTIELIDLGAFRPHSIQVAQVYELKHEWLPLVGIEVFHHCLWSRVCWNSILDSDSSKDGHIGISAAPNEKRQQEDKLTLGLVTVGSN